MPSTQNRIVTGELAVILQIVQTGIQGLPDARVRPQRQPLPIELHRQAIGMLMVAFAAVQRIHQAPPGIHAVALHQPTDLRHIKVGLTYVSMSPAAIVVSIVKSSCG